MAQISLKKIDPHSLDDQKFTYEIVKYRWSNANIVNIKYKSREEMPSFEEHINVLASKKYKQLYKIFLGEFALGMIYIDVNNVNGTFLVPSFVKTAFKELKKRNEYFDIRQITPQTHILLFRAHPDVNVHYATANPGNTLSIKAMLDNGYEHIESVFAMKTENGEIQQGPWKV